MPYDNKTEFNYHRVIIPTHKADISYFMKQ
jgi:hypothetical protein